MNSIASLFLVIPSSREAVLVVSPIAVYSTRCSEPTLPAITGPLLRPTPISKPRSKPCSISHALKLLQARSDHLSAAATARSAWSSCSSGAPKTAMIPSPM